VYDWRVQLRLPWDFARPTPRARQLVVAGDVFPIDVVRHRWARRYIVRVTSDGRVRLTVPRGASIDGGVQFAWAERDWIAREWKRVRAAGASWTIGASIWYRGAKVAIDADGAALAIGPERIAITAAAREHGGLIAAHLRGIAERELPARCLELAAACGLDVGRVSVRDQKSRWGACSPTRTITLNWRLIQMPASVADYVMLHELMHLRQANHSRRFWREVDRACPWWREAERWLRRHGRELL
jgi:predicted metal-dependent hydrolase